MKYTACKGCGLFLRKDLDELLSNTVPHLPYSEIRTRFFWPSTVSPMKQSPNNCKRYLEGVSPGCPKYRHDPNDRSRIVSIVPS